MRDTSPFKQVHFPGSSGRPTTAGKAPSCFFRGVNPPEMPVGRFCREWCRTKQVFFIPLTLFSVLDSVVLPVLQKIVSSFQEFFVTWNNSLPKAVSTLPGWWDCEAQRSKPQVSKAHRQDKLGVYVWGHAENEVQHRTTWWSLGCFIRLSCGVL